MPIATPDSPASNPASGPGVAAGPATAKTADPKALGYKTDASKEREKALQIAGKLFAKDAKKKAAEGDPEPLEEEGETPEEDLEEIAEEVDEDALEDVDDEPAKPEPKAAKKKTATPTTPEAKEAAKKAAADKATADAAKMDKAKKALLRDGMKPGVLAKLSDEEVLELGEIRAGQQAQVDAFGNELKRLKAGTPAAAVKTAAAKAKDEAAAAGDEGAEADAGAEESTAVPANISAILDGMEEHAGPEVTKALKDAFASLSNSRQAELQAANQVSRTMLLRGARKDLTEAYPQIKDSKEWDKVVELATALVQSGRYNDGDEDQLFQDAARVAFPNATETAQRRLLNRQKKAKAGQIDRGGDNREGASKKLTPHDQASLAGKLLAQGKKPSAIRRLLAQSSS